MSGPAALQLVLELEPGAPADTPPPCECCHGRRYVPCAPIGWAFCTWCEGTGVDPDAVVPVRLAVRGPVLELLAS